jgi:hypothetical protein
MTCEIPCEEIEVRLSRWMPPERIPLPLRKEHLRAQGTIGNDVRCLYLEAGRGWVAYPIVLRPVPGARGREWFDLDNPFEFGGLFGGSEDPHGVPPWDAFFEAFDRWGKDHRIVTEFVRFDPLVSFPLDVLSRRYRRRQVPAHVVFDLERNRDAPLREASNPARRNARRTEREGAVFESLAPDKENLRRFAELYEETMRLRNADRRFLFGMAYYETQALASYGRLFGVRLGGQIMAASLVLVWRDRAYHHLTGWHPDAAPLRINEFLLASLARWGAGEGLRLLHLGGGSASIRAFKAKFSRATVPYHVGMRVWNEEAYRELCSAAGVGPSIEGFFPAYRSPKEPGIRPAGAGQVFATPHARPA